MRLDEIFSNNNMNEGWRDLTPEERRAHLQAQIELINQQAEQARKNKERREREQAEREKDPEYQARRKAEHEKIQKFYELQTLYDIAFDSETFDEFKKKTSHLKYVTDDDLRKFYKEYNPRTKAEKIAQAEKQLQQQKAEYEYWSKKRGGWTGD